MGSHSRVKRSLIYLFILFNIFYSVYCFANPLFFGATALAIEVFGSRAAVSAAMNLSRVTLTRFAVRAAANEALYTIPVSSSLRIGGKATWAGLASTIGGYAVSELMSGDTTLQAATNASLNPDGSYSIDIEKNGIKQQINVNFQPTILDPVFIYIESVTQGEPNKVADVEEGYDYPDNARFYITKNTYTAPYYFGDNYEEVALQAQQFRTYSNYSPRYTEFEKLVTDKIVDSQGNISFTEKPYKFRYVNNESTFDFDIIGVTPNSIKYTSSGGLKYHPDIEGLSMDYTVFIKVTTHTNSIKSGFEPCKTTYSSNGSTSTICLPPEEYDYINSDREFTYNLRVSTNSDYSIAAINYKQGTLEELEPYIESDLKTQAVDYKKLANIYNEILRNASSQEDYQGLPYSSSNPITESEIKQAVQNLGQDLSVYDLLYEPISSDGDLLPDLENRYTTIINNITNGGNNGGNNSGNNNNDENYDFIAPELEDVPTGEDILSMFDDLFPFLRDFELKDKNANCPTAEFEAFGSIVKIDTHCPLLEDNRSLFETIMLIVWAFVSLRIVLKA